MRPNVKSKTRFIQCKSITLIFIRGDSIDIYFDFGLFDNIRDESKKDPERYGILLRDRAPGEKLPHRLWLCTACPRRPSADIINTRAQRNKDQGQKDRRARQIN